MRVPILKQGAYLIASVQSALADQSLVQLQDDLAQMVGRHQSKGVIIDVTSLDIIDSFAAPHAKINGRYNPFARCSHYHRGNSARGCFCHGTTRLDSPRVSTRLWTLKKA